MCKTNLPCASFVWLVAVTVAHVALVGTGKKCRLIEPGRDIYAVWEVGSFFLVGRWYEECIKWAIFYLKVGFYFYYLVERHCCE